MNELVLKLTITIHIPMLPAPVVPMPPEERNTPVHENDSAA